MAESLWSAIIAALGTISAASIAGLVVIKGARNWQREVPGRRRIEVAEECLSAAYNHQTIIKDYRQQALLWINNMANGNTRLKKEDHDHIFERLDQQAKAVTESYERLLHTTHLAQIYFDYPFRISLEWMDGAYGRVQTELNIRYDSARFSDDMDIAKRAVQHMWDCHLRLSNEHYKRPTMDELPSATTNLG
jgi:hypothetical protein